MKKKILAIVGVALVIIITVILLIVFGSKKDYTRTYEIDSYKIEEVYNEELGAYFFHIRTEDNEYDTAITSTKVGKGLIKDVDLYEDEDLEESCILPNGEKLEFTPICIKGRDYVDFSFIEGDTEDFYKRDKTKKNTNTYKNIEVYRTNNLRFLIWAHKGYLKLSDSTLKNSSKVDVDLTFLEKDSYYNNLAYKADNYVITPNYDASHTFSTLYIFNFISGEAEKWDIDYDISFNSYYLGDMDGKIYLFDRKERVEYLIDPRKKRIEVISEHEMGQVYLGEWKSVSTTKLASKDYTFEKRYTHEYSITKDGLIMKHYGSKVKTLISDFEATKIIGQDGDRVYYLVDDSLYEYSPKYGETLLLTYSEWSFNNMNSVFVY